MIRVEIANRQQAIPLDEQQLRQAVQLALAAGDITSAAIGLAVVDDAVIHDLNRRYLAHDFPTDVLSFPLESETGSVAGEIVVSADTALRTAAQYGWLPHAELLLYAVHGALHLAGFDDHDPMEMARMRAAEVRILAEFKLRPHYDGEGTT